VYQAGYWLAQRGKFNEALAILKTAKNLDDPRILNYIGFVKRKLGHVREAVSYYRRALVINPDYTIARAYFGEALLQMGLLDHAKHQLVEIYRRCGSACAEYGELSRQIVNYQHAQ
ncbi:MAG: tetratricopeptide repeat protein, partial [Hyphomicrobiaceae bacterium]